MKKNKLNITLVVVAVVALFVVGADTVKTMGSKSVFASIGGDFTSVSQNNNGGVINLAQENAPESFEGSIVDGVQVIEFDLNANSYPNLYLKKGVPVKLIVNADEQTLNSCNYQMLFNDFEVGYRLGIGQNLMEFTPNESGDFIYSCYMGMIGANITVSDDLETPRAEYGANVSAGGGCCR